MSGEQEPFLMRGVSIEGAPARDIGVADGHLVRAADLGHEARVLEATGLVLLPGLVDLHTHLRDPGDGLAETMATGTRAAARGGYTTVFAMANTTPVADSVEVVEQELDSARAADCEVRPVGAVTVGLQGIELSDIAGMAASRAQVRWFSDDGMCVADPAIMRAALVAIRDVGGTLAQHSQEPRLTEGAQLNEGAETARRLGLPGWPAMAEEIIIARDAIMAHHLGSRVHVCHVSTAGAVAVVRWAKEQGYPLTAEVTPHHLSLTDELAGEDAVFKVNPPLRTAADVEAVRSALAEGVIDAVATDHAPHPDPAKARSWCEAPMGMLGLETAVAVVADVMLGPGHSSWTDVAVRMSRAPAALGGTAAVTDRPLREGDIATFCLVDPGLPWTVDSQQLASLGHNTPFSGRQLPVRVVFTSWAGRVTHDIVQGRAPLRVCSVNS